MANSWYCQMLGEVFGPMALDDLRGLVKRRQLLRSDLVREGETGAWVAVETLPVLNGAGPAKVSSTGPNPVESRPKTALPYSNLPSPPKSLFVPPAVERKSLWQSVPTSMLVTSGLAALLAVSGFVLFLMSGSGRRAESDEKPIPVAASNSPVESELSVLREEVARLQQQMVEREARQTVSGSPPAVPAAAVVVDEPLADPVAELEPKEVAAEVVEAVEPALPLAVAADFADVISAVEPSIVRIEVQLDEGGSLGSGFIVARPDLVVTNFHVVKGAIAASVVFQDGQRMEVEGFMTFAEKKDLAVLVLKSARPDVKPLVLAGDSARKGEHVIAVGAPKGLSFTVSEGVVSSMRTVAELKAALEGFDATIWDDDATFVQTTASMSPGNSGGPLVTKSGQVVGVNTWKRIDGDDLNFAVHVRHILPLIDAANADVHPLAELPRSEKPVVARAPRDGAGGIDAVIGKAIRDVAQRMNMLRQIYDQRIVLIARRENIKLRTEPVRRELVERQAEYARLFKEAASVQSEFNQLAQENSNLANRRNFTQDPITRIEIDSAIRSNESRGRILQSRYNSLDASATSVNIEGQALAAQLATLEAEMATVYAEADQLRLEWLGLVDPWGDFDREDHRASIATFSEWIVLDGQNAEAFIARGIAYMRLGERDKALTDFSRAVDLGGASSSMALAARGGLLHAMGKPKEAMADIGKALKLDKTNSFVFLCRARIRCAEGQFKSALSDFESAVRVNGRDYHALRQLAILRAACPRDTYRNGKKAITSATLACAITKDQNAACLSALAAAYAESGEFDKAIAAMEKAKELTWGDGLKKCEEQLAQYRKGQPLRLDNWGL